MNQETRYAGDPKIKNKDGDSSIILSEIYPKVEHALSQKHNVDRLIKGIMNYQDRNSHILFSLNFSIRLIIGEDDKKFVYESIGMSENEIKKVINSSSYSNVTWVMVPFTVALAMAVRYFELHKKDKEAKLCVLYLSLLYYTLSHAGLFKILPNREIMDYTLNKNPNITNNFIIKKEGSIFGMIKHTVNISHDSYIGGLINPGSDKDVNDYLSGIRTRIRSNLKNIMTYFIDDHKNGNYFNKDTESLDEDNYHLTDSTIMSIHQVSTKVSTKMASYGFNEKIIKIVANQSIETSPIMIRNIVSNIVHQHRSEIDKFVMAIIELFVIDGENNISEVGTSKFLAHSFQLYKTNSTKPRVIEIKKMLDTWIENGTQKHGLRIIRAGTINAYRRAIFNVFVYSISQDSK